MVYAVIGAGTKLADFQRTQEYSRTKSSVKITLADGTVTYAVYSASAAVVADDQTQWEWRLAFDATKGDAEREATRRDFDAELMDFGAIGARVVFCEIGQPLVLVGYGQGGYDDPRCTCILAKVKELALAPHTEAASVGGVVYVKAMLRITL